MKTKRTRRHPALNRENNVLYVEDVMEILGIGQTKAYGVIRKLNDQIEAAGYERPIGGRVSETYFRERYYLGRPSPAPSVPPAPKKRTAQAATAHR